MSAWAFQPLAPSAAALAGAAVEVSAQLNAVAAITATSQKVAIVSAQLNAVAAITATSQKVAIVSAQLNAVAAITATVATITATSEEVATRAGYPDKKRKHRRLGPEVREPSPWEYSWQRRAREAADAFERLEKAEPRAAELAPPREPTPTLQIDPALLDGLLARIDAFDVTRKRAKVAAALADYREHVARYQAEVAAWHAEQERLAAEMAMAADDEDVLMAYAQRRRNISKAAAIAAAIDQIERYAARGAAVSQTMKSLAKQKPDASLDELYAEAHTN